MPGYHTLPVTYVFLYFNPQRSLNLQPTHIKRIYLLPSTPTLFSTSLYYSCLWFPSPCVCRFPSISIALWIAKKGLSSYTIHKSGVHIAFIYCLVCPLKFTSFSLSYKCTCLYLLIYFFSWSFHRNDWNLHFTHCLGF